MYVGQPTETMRHERGQVHMAKCLRDFECLREVDRRQIEITVILRVDAQIIEQTPERLRIANLAREPSPCSKSRRACPEGSRSSSCDVTNRSTPAAIPSAL